jgi:hypothetical protein
MSGDWRGRYDARSGGRSNRQDGRRREEDDGYAFGLGVALLGQERGQELVRDGFPLLLMKNRFHVHPPPVPPGQLSLLLRDSQFQLALLWLSHSFSVCEPREEHRHHGILGTHEAMTSIAL